LGREIVVGLWGDTSWRGKMETKGTITRSLHVI